MATHRKPLRLTLPATSANLGPAFDAAALALKLYLKITARKSNDFSITARGRDANICGRIRDHLILTTYVEILQAENKPIPPLALIIDNEIPIGKGCGSSAAARLAAIALANHFGKLKWSDTRIVAEASRREHHPDNAAACWMGGLAVARMEGDADAHIARIVPRGKWPILLAVPDDTLPTEEARRVLPKEYSCADAVANIQNSMLLLAAFSQGRKDLLRAALHDRIHEPYRAPLCPLLPALQSLTRNSGILGVTLSGAGPSVLIFLDPEGIRDPTAPARRQIAAHLRQRGLKAELISTEISRRGTVCR